MRTQKHKSFFLSVAFCFLFMIAGFAQQSAIYAGGPVYNEREYAIDELRNSGFKTVIVWTIHLNDEGDLKFNGDFPLVEDGEYIGNQMHPDFPADILRLKEEPTFIDRVEFGLSSAGSGTFDAVKDFYESEGLGPGSTIYENFKALRDAVPGIDAFNNDDESTYDSPSAIAFTKMLAALGYKNAIVPYQNTTFWSTLVQSVNEEFPGNIDRNYLQCYAGGAFNDPCSASWDFGIPVYPGLWGGTGRDTPGTVENRMNGWKNECGISGGFMWVYDDFDNSPRVAAYASALNRVFLDGDLPGAATDPNPDVMASDVETDITLSWEAGSNVETHELYFGTNPNPGLDEFVGSLTETTYAVTDLELRTTYYWRVDEINETGRTVGTVWYFTTESGPITDHTDPVGTGSIIARAQINEAESAARAFDNLDNGTGAQNETWSKWLDNGGIPSDENPSWIQIALPNPVIVTVLTLTSGNDAPERDPQNFNLQGSNDGVTWTTLRAWSDQTFADRFEKKDFVFENKEAFSWYRLDITKNAGNVGLTQITEIELLGPNDTTLGNEIPGNNGNSDLLKEMKIRSNPVRNVLKISLPTQNSIDQILIYTVTGKLVLYKNIQAQSQEIAIEDVSGLTPGMYFVRATGQGQSLTGKMVKK